MFPFLNFFNMFDDTSSNTFYSSEEKGFCMVANRLIQTGEEISLKALSPYNDYFLLKKGFVHPFRQLRIPVTAQLSQSDPMFNEKRELMSGKSARQFYIPKTLNDP